MATDEGLSREAREVASERTRLLMTIVMDGAFVLVVFAFNFGISLLAERVGELDRIDDATIVALRVLLAAGTIGCVGMLVLRDLVRYGIRMVKSVRNG